MAHDHIHSTLTQHTDGAGEVIREEAEPVRHCREPSQFAWYGTREIVVHQREEVFLLSCVVCVGVCGGVGDWDAGYQVGGGGG